MASAPTIREREGGSWSASYSRGVIRSSRDAETPGKMGAYSVCAAQMFLQFLVASTAPDATITDRRIVTSRDRLTAVFGDRPRLSIALTSRDPCNSFTTWHNCTNA